MIRLRSSHRRKPFLRAVRAGLGLALVAGLIGLPGGPASAAAFVVNSTADGADATPGDVLCATATGACTLRAAIGETNAIAGADLITFAPTVTLIRPGGALPAITGTVTIDGSVASSIPPNFPVPGVELDGSLAGTADGLTILGATTQIRGLAVNRFAGDGIVVRADDVQIAGTYVGTDLTGMVAAGNAGVGIHAIGATGLLIGGASFLTDRTIASANARGIVIEGGGSSTITSALVGTDATTEGDLGNGGDGLTIVDHQTASVLSNQVSGNDGVGIVVQNTDGVSLNGNAVGVDLGGGIALPNASGVELRGGTGMSEGVSVASNQIAANLGVGVRVGDANPGPGVGVSGLTFVNNAIGTDPGGQANLGNGGDGIHFVDGDNDGAVIGGSAAQANRIAFNGGAGVRVGAGNANERIQANAIYDNVGLGILLDPTANGDQQPPLLTAVIGPAPDVTVEGTLTGFLPNHDYRIEFFGNPDCATGAGEGRAFLRQRTFATDGSGAASFSTVIPLGAWGAVTATATDDVGTSQFSNCLQLGGGGAASADLSIDKAVTSAPPFVGGADLTYRLTIDNLGPDAAGGVAVSDPLPAGTGFLGATPSQGSCQDAAGVVTCDLGSLAAGAQATVDLTVALPDVADLTALQNTASVSSTTADPDTADNVDAVAIDVLARRPDLALAKSAPADVTEGDAFDYALTVTNHGPDAAHGVILTDPLPAEVAFVAAVADQGSCSEAAGTVSCDLGTLASGDAVGVTISVGAGAYAGADTRSFDNTASVASDRPDAAPGDEQATATVTEHPAGANLSLTKTDGLASAPGGEPLAYTLTVGNGGPGDATGVTLTDPLPAGTTFGSAIASQGSCAEQGGTVTCALGDLADGGEATVTLSLDTDPVDVDTPVTNTASVDAAESDPDPSNDAAADDTTLQPVGGADLRIAGQDDAPDPVTGGYDVAYAVEIRNDGGDDAHDVVLTDTLPAGTSFVTPNPNPFGCQAAQGVVSCALGTIAAGSSQTVLVILDTPGVSATSTLSNAVAVSSPDDANATNDADTETTTLLPRQAAFAAGYVPPNAPRLFITDAITTWPGGWPIATSSDPTTAAVLTTGGGPGGVLSIAESACGGSFACRIARVARGAGHDGHRGSSSPPTTMGNVVSFSPPPGATPDAPYTGFLYLDRSIVTGTSGIRVAFRDAQTGAFVASLPWCGRSGPAPACVADIDRIWSWLDRVHLDLRVKVRFLGAGSFAVMR